MNNLRTLTKKLSHMGEKVVADFSLKLSAGVWLGNRPVSRLVLSGLVLCSALNLAGCISDLRRGGEGIMDLASTPDGALDGGDPKGLIRALDLSLKRLAKKDQQETYTYGKQKVSVAEMAEMLRDLKAKVAELGTGEKLSEYLEDNYKFFTHTGGPILVTGYYEAELRGSRVRTSRYQYPIYRKPNDVLEVELPKFSALDKFKGGGLPDSVIGREYKKGKVGPYYSRADIDGSKKLSGRRLELCFVDDPVALFFLHIQGSGVITLPDKSTIRVNFAGRNGHPYRSIGQVLSDEKKLKKGEVTAQAIEKYLRANPKDARRIFDSNPSYIFFREVKEGPLGSIGVPLTPFRSIATDSKLYPRGAPALLRTKIPIVNSDGEVIGHKPFTQLVLNQDTGGAIQGPRRVDLFTGRGAVAQGVAGALKAAGELFFIAKRQ